MTEDEGFEVHKVKEQLYDKLHSLLNEETEHLTTEQDEALRQQLTDEFRFWRESND